MSDHLPSLDYNLSFAGCGFLCVYHIGVMLCIKRFASVLYRDRPVSGASAGAFAGTFLICDVDLVKATEFLMRIINDSRKYCLGAFDPRFKITDYIREGLDQLLPEDAHKRCSGRLFISMTHKTSNQNLLVSHFNSRDDLIQALLCSSFIPVFAGFTAPVYRNDYFIDGALSDNLPVLNKKTILISPFCGDADICPRDDIWEPSELSMCAGQIFLSQTSLILNPSNLKRILNVVIPMSSKDLGRLARSGYEDALRFLLTRGMIACEVHQNPCQMSCFSSVDVRRTLKRSRTVEILSSATALPQVPSHIFKSASRNLLCELTNPHDTSFYKTSFGSRSFAVPDCTDCRLKMLTSYVSKLPSEIYALISDETEEIDDLTEKEDESSIWWPFPAKLNRFPRWAFRSVLANQVAAQILRLLFASTMLPVSVVQYSISLSLGLIHRLPKSSALPLEPVVVVLTSLDSLLAAIVKKGTERSQKLADLLKANKGLDETFNCLLDMLRSDLLAAVPHFSPGSRSPLPEHSLSVWFPQDLPMSPSFAQNTRKGTPSCDEGSTKPVWNLMQEF